MSTVHQFPVQRNQPPAAPEEVADALGVAIDAAVGADASFEAREAAALALTNEATRLFLERELLAIADGHGSSRLEVDVLFMLTSGDEPFDRAVMSPRCWPESTSSGGPTAKWACAMARRWSTSGHAADAVPGGADDPGATASGLPLGYAKDHMRS